MYLWTTNDGVSGYYFSGLIWHCLNLSMRQTFNQAAVEECNNISQKLIDNLIRIVGIIFDNTVR